LLDYTEEQQHIKTKEYFERNYKINDKTFNLVKFYQYAFEDRSLDRLANFTILEIL
jgi:hypothetical protein